MRRATVILSAFAVFFTASYYVTPPPAEALQGTILVDPNEPFEELGTFPLLPVPEDPKAIPPLPAEVNELVNVKSMAIFDTSVMEKDLMGYPFPQVKVSFIANGNTIVIMTLLLDDDFNMPDPDENSILEVRWFSADPANLNSPKPRMKQWVNLPLIQKLLKKMMGEDEPEEKIKI